jgi:uncharacterized membrane protein
MSAAYVGMPTKAKITAIEGSTDSCFLIHILITMHEVLFRGKKNGVVLGSLLGLKVLIFICFIFFYILRAPNCAPILFFIRYVRYSSRVNLHSL